MMLEPVRRRRMRGGLLRKYVVIFVGVVGASLLVSGVVQAVFSYQDNRDAILRGQQETVAATAANIRHMVEQAESQLEIALQQADPRTQPDYAATNVSIEARRGDYRAVLLRVPAITEISYIDPQGRLQLHLSRLTPRVVVVGTDLSSDPTFLVPKTGKTYYGPTHLRHPCGRLTAGTFTGPVIQCLDELERDELQMTIAVPYEPGVPFVGTAEKVGGVTVAEVNLGALQEMISQIRPGTAGYAYVVDSREQLVAGPLGLGVFPQTDLSSLEQVRSVVGSPHSGASATSVTARNLLGTEVFSAAERIDPPGWAVLVEQPRDDALSPLNGFIARTAVLLVVGLIIAALASLLLARRMARPILALQGAASRIGSGHLDERIQIRGGDELAALGDTFNRMAEELRESYRGLEDKVADRTRDLADASRRLASASQHKSEFLANMSHELRTPLNAIIGFSEVLLARMFGDINAKQEDYLNDILGSGRHLLTLINDILDLSKVEAGHMELQVEQFHLPQTLQSSVALMQEAAIREGVDLRIEIDAGVGLIDGDERRIKQVLINLLSNAIKFTPNGGHIRVRASTAGEGVTVAVSDDGPGIAEADQGRVFEEFEQAGSGHGQEGTGLGLALSRKFVTMHGGELWLTSAPGVGSTFTFTIPVSGAGAVARPGQPAPPTAEGRS